MSTRHKARTLLTFCALLTMASAFVILSRDTAARTELPTSRPAQGLTYQGLRRATAADAACENRFVLPDGSCTHGPDPLLPGRSINDTAAPVQDAGLLRPQAVICNGDGVSGPRVQIAYVRETDRPDRYAEYLESIRVWVSDMDEIFFASARETDGDVRVRFVTSAGCVIDVLNIVVPAGANADLGTTINALRTLKHNRVDRKYLLFVDANVYCGIAQSYADDRADSGSPHNRGPMYGRVDSACWGPQTAAHELVHTLGGVQNSAPNSTYGKDGSIGGHCTDEQDILCYADVDGLRPPMSNVCPASPSGRLDCNHDDYFHTNPPAGSYLASRWNVVNNVFLIRDAGPPGPVITETPQGQPTATLMPEPTLTPTRTLAPSRTPTPGRITRRVFMPALGR
jgi:hypothetical protein